LKSVLRNRKVLLEPGVALTPPHGFMRIAASDMRSELLNIPEPPATPEACALKSRFRKNLDAVVEAISSLESGLKELKTIRDFVHPESLQFALRLAVEQKNGLMAEYEDHLRAHGC